MYLDLEQQREIWLVQCEDDFPITFKEWVRQNRNNYDLEEDPDNDDDV